MRILVCTSELPYAPITGTRLVLAELLPRLAERHEITVVGYRWPEQQASPLPEGVRVAEAAPPARSRAARATGWLRASRTQEPLQAQGLVAPLARLVHERLRGERFDVAHVTGPVIAGLSAALQGHPKVLVALDAWHLNARSQTEEASGPMKLVRRAEERRIERFQAREFGAYDDVVVVSERDAQELRDLGTQARVEVIPNGVDARRFSPADGPPEPGLLVFVGTMRWAPNIHAALHLAEEVLPRVRERHPEARLAIVGRAVTPEVRERLGRSPGVEVVGEVDDVADWVRRASVFACPMLDGTGIKNKVLESLACAAPTVATPLACQGLEVQDGRELRIAAAGEPFARAVGELLDAPAAAAELGRRGRAYVERRHDWDAVARDFERVYDRAVGAGTPGVAAS